LPAAFISVIFSENRDPLEKTMSDTKIVARVDVPEKYRWKATNVFPTVAEWEEAYRQVISDLEDAASFQGKLGDSKEMLLKWFAFREKLLTLTGKLRVYATMDRAVDMLNQEAGGRFDRSRSLMARVQAGTAFGDTEIIEIGFDKLNDWISQDARLVNYRHYFERLNRMKSHLRSAEIEEVLGQVMDPFQAAATIHSTLSDTDLQFQPAQNQEGLDLEIAQSSINALLTDPDRKVRRSAWENYSDAYLELKNTCAGCLSAGVKQNVFMARVRNYESSLQAALAPENIPVEVFHNLIETFRQNLPVWHRYWRLRKKTMGYDHLYVYDIKAPLTQKSFDISFEDAVGYIYEGMKALGLAYANQINQGVLENGWVDSFPNRGKRAGAFSTGSPGINPFIMMSYNNDIYGVSTLAHELGHSMHSYLTFETQPFIYSRYSLFVAEVASNFNQAMVRAYLLNTVSDRDFRIAIIEEAMSNFHRYLFIMPTLARFEVEIHRRVEQGIALTADSLIDLLAGLFEEGYGGVVETDRERSGITWAQFPVHLYSNFYVYQYATGISGAHALAQGVLDDHPGAVDKYLNFLRAGGSLYPLDALRLAGVDLAQPEPIQKTFDILSGLIDQLEALLL
jgi:oligoendopeptidase F